MRVKKILSIKRLCEIYSFSYSLGSSLCAELRRRAGVMEGPSGGRLPGPLPCRTLPKRTKVTGELISDFQIFSKSGTKDIIFDRYR